MGDDKRMSDEEFRSRMRRATMTPGERLHDWFILKLAQVGGLFLLVWIVLHLNAIIDWWNGK
jgi:hypothetical protein